MTTSAVISAAVGIDTSLTMVYQLFALLLCIIIVSRLSLRLQKPKVSIRRRLPKYATAGEPFEYFINVANEGTQPERDLRLIDNPKVLPPDFEQFDRSREPGEETRNAYDRWLGFHRFIWLQRLNTGVTIKQGMVPEISLKAAVDTPMEATPLRRGIVNFQSITLLCPDPFGLNYSVSNFPDFEQLMILPRRYAIPKSFELPGGRHFQPGGVNSTWSIGESDEFVSLRDYRDGDSMRKIHWASTAKRDKPVVKEFQDEFFVRQAIILDTAVDDMEVLEETISVAASLLLQSENTDGLMDLIYVADVAKIVTAGRGHAQPTHQLEVLATIGRNEGTPEKLLDVVAAHQRLLSGAMLVLPGWTDEHKRLVRMLGKLPLAIFIITREEENLTEVPAGANVLPLGKIAERLAGA